MPSKNHEHALAFGPKICYNPRMETKFINLTPHAIVLNDGTVFPPSGKVARVSVQHGPFVEGICVETFGEVTGIPSGFDGQEVRFIVSAMVLAAMRGKDARFVAPATGHQDCVREKGQIVSVPGFVR
jgi:hypothetical protein